MTPRCIARGCRRLSTSLVPVGWRILSDEILRQEPGMAARPSVIARLCPDHEQDVAEGKVVPVARNVVLRDVA